MHISTGWGSECQGAQIFPRMTFKLSEIFDKCTGAGRARFDKNDFKCCRSGQGGKWCFMVTKKPGEYYGDDRPFNDELLLDHASPCDFGYCTDGRVDRIIPFSGGGGACLTSRNEGL